jgi:HSP90 family molecular chaperone
MPKLRERLSALDNTLYMRLNAFEVRMRELLEYAQGGGHIVYTTHGLSHITAVERNYDWLISDEDMQLFNSIEIYCLLCATFCHDSQMIPRKLGMEAQARSNHAKLVFDFLMTNRDLLQINVNEANAIAQVVKGHAVDSLEQIQEEQVIGSTLVDIRKLAACLSLSDICHADASRAPQIVFNHLVLDEDSSFHWVRHMQISGITRKGNSLLVSAFVYTDDGAQAVKAYTKGIENQIKIINPYFHDILMPITKVQLQLTKLRSRLDKPLRFQPNMSAILNILTGSVYERSDAFIRELVQNSIDACSIRAAQSRKRGEPYMPVIVVTSYTDARSVRAVRVDDNGIGMDINDLEKTVLWIGNSIASQDDVRHLVQEQLNKSLIARFGIGLLSCFKVAEEIKISSCKRVDEAFEFSTRSVGDEIQPKESYDTSVGSTVMVRILPQHSGELDASYTLSHYFRALRGVELRFLTLEWSEDGINEHRSKIIEIASSEAVAILPSDLGIKKHPEFNVEIRSADVYGVLWLTHGIRPDSLGANGTITWLVDGIFVSEDETIQWLPSYLAMCSGILNISSDKVDLPVSRDRIMRNEKSLAVKDDLLQKSLIVFEKLVEITKKRPDIIGNIAALLLTRMLSNADKKLVPMLVRYLDSYVIRRVGGLIGVLGEIRSEKSSKVYIRTPEGRFVKRLTVIDGKTIYHKSDDITELNGAILSQTKHTVIETSRHDDDNLAINEATLIKTYLQFHGIAMVELTSGRMVDVSLKNKPLSANAKNIIGKNVRFVEVDRLPNHRSWIVGDDVVINTANPAMLKIYNTLKLPQMSDRQILIIELLMSILRFEIQDAITNLIGQLSEPSEPST